MKFKLRKFRVPPGRKVDLKLWPTRVKPVYATKRAYRRLLQARVQALAARQRLLYASNRHAVLVIFQAMDAAGKDGAIRHVLSGINPQGCQVCSFKHPSATELDHDFLWRTTRDLPERGRIGVFNRSYYEEVLIVRVHPEILRNENLPNPSPPKKLWPERYRSIVELEKHLHRNGTRIVKIFLHLSRAEQKRRFRKRLEDPEKNWKFCAADVAESKLWPQYMRAYAACLGATSTRAAPWHVVPADDKRNARLLIAEILHDTFARLKMAYPRPDAKRRRELRAFRRQFAG